MTVRISLFAAHVESPHDTNGRRAVDDDDDIAAVITGPHGLTNVVYDVVVPGRLTFITSSPTTIFGQGGTISRGCKFPSPQRTVIQWPFGCRPIPSRVIGGSSVLIVDFSKRELG